MQLFLGSRPRCFRLNSDILNTFHGASSDIALLPGVVIPAGAILTAPIQLIQRDTVYWGDDAAIFNPDRFLKPRRIASGELASEQNQNIPHPCNFTKEPLQLNPAFLVFGAGSRSCIGSSLAVKQISILVTVILKRFEVNALSHSLHI